jgi:hypothetical protein
MMEVAVPRSIMEQALHEPVSGWRDSLIHRDLFTANPAQGDYILSSTGLTWGICRANDDGSVMSLFAGENNRKAAVATLVSLAKRDNADAWETVGFGSFRLIKRYRLPI